MTLPERKALFKASETVAIPPLMVVLGDRATVILRESDSPNQRILFRQVPKEFLGSELATGPRRARSL